MGFGNGAFQAAKIAIDKYTIKIDPTTGKIHTSISAVVTYDDTTISENPNGQLEVKPTAIDTNTLITPDGTSLNLNPSTSTLQLNTANSNVWDAVQTFSEGLKTNSAQNTLIGTTAGTVVYSEPFIGLSYKKVVVYLDSYENNTTTAQTITYSTVFSTIAVIIYNNTGLTTTEISTSLTVLTINPDNTTLYSGSVMIEGY